METELQLFDPRGLNSTLIKQPDIKEGSLVSPLHNSQKSLEESLNTLFPTYKEETKLQKAKRVLGGEIVSEVTDEQLEIFLTEVQFLLDSWLDSFERTIFDGLTLKQILKGE
ncbi:MAG: hypothetical protein WCV81_02945 [Microgenomates group bacterium]|jgi:hypothetical protein